MGNSISFEMSSTYSPEWKKELELSTLYDYIAKYKKEVENEKDSEKYPLHDQVMDRVNSSDDSSIRSKLKKKLHLDISESINLRGKERYEENYKEKYDALKLLYFLATFAKIEEGSITKGIDPLDLLIYSSLQHTDAANAVYAKDFKRMITELRPAVTDPENREDTINWIHGLWEQMHVNISCATIIQMTFMQGQVKNDDLEKIVSQLQMIKDSIDIEIIYSTSYLSDGILNAFYNKMLCSRRLAEIADMQKVIYDYQDETAVTKDVSDLFKSNAFSQPMTWEEFGRIIDFKTVESKSPIDMAVWAILLGKSEFSRQEIKTIDRSEYRFALKYTKDIAEYWVLEVLQRDSIQLAEWVLVFQELMFIRSHNIVLDNRYLRFTNAKQKLTAAIKKFEEASQFPRLVLIERLNNRLLLSNGALNLLASKQRAIQLLNEIEQSIFSYKTLNDIQGAHYGFYFLATAALSTNIECSSVCESFDSILASQLESHGMPPMSLSVENIYDVQFLQILSQDKYYTMIQNPTIMEQLNGFTEALLQGTEAMMDEVARRQKEVKPSEYMYEKAAILLADNICKNVESDSPADTIWLQLPITFGEKHNYIMKVYFTMDASTNTVHITGWQYRFIRQ